MRRAPARYRKYFVTDDVHVLPRGSNKVKGKTVCSLTRALWA